MNTELSLEFSEGYKWLGEIGESPEPLFKRIIKRIKRLFTVL